MLVVYVAVLSVPVSCRQGETAAALRHCVTVRLGAWMTHIAETGDKQPKAEHHVVRGRLE